jgi:hypothetical protein
MGHQRAAVDHAHAEKRAPVIHAVGLQLHAQRRARDHGLGHPPGAHALDQAVDGHARIARAADVVGAHAGAAGAQRCHHGKARGAATAEGRRVAKDLGEGALQRAVSAVDDHDVHAGLGQLPDGLGLASLLGGLHVDDAGMTRHVLQHHGCARSASAGAQVA